MRKETAKILNSEENMSNKDCSQQSKPGLTRRKFIQSIALGSGALFLGSRWGVFSAS